MRFSVVLILLCLLLPGCLAANPSGGRPGLTAEDSAQQKRESSAADAMDKAMQLYHDGEFLEPEAALEYLTEAIELDPTLVQALYHRSVLLFNRGRVQEALIDANATIKLRPDYKEALFARGFILMRLGDYSAAVKDLSKVIKRDNSLSEAYAQRGICYMRLGRHEDAIHDFDQTLALHPAHFDANLQRGLAKMGLGQYEAAAHDLTQAYSLNPDSYDTVMARAAVYIELGKYDRAVTDVRRAIVLEPGKSGLYALLGEALAGTGDIPTAIKATENALRLARAQGETDLAAVYQEQLDEFRSLPEPKAKDEK